MYKNSDRSENDGATDIIADSLHINHIFAVSCSDQSTAVLCACLFVYLCIWDTLFIFKTRIYVQCEAINSVYHRIEHDCNC